MTQIEARTGYYIKLQPIRAWINNILSNNRHPPFPQLPVKKRPSIDDSLLPRSIGSNDEAITFVSVFLRFFERKRDGKREGGKRRGGWHDYRGVFFPLGRELEEKRRNQRVLAQMDNNGRHDLDPCRGFTIALWKVTIGENSSRERGASRWKRKNHAGEERSRYGRKQRAKINPLSSINQTSIDSNPRSHPPFNPFFQSNRSSIYPPSTSLPCNSISFRRVVAMYGYDIGDDNKNHELILCIGVGKKLCEMGNGFLRTCS